MAVAVVASGSLLASVGGGGIDIGVVIAMLSGGVLAAPLAAWVVRFLPARVLGVAVGGLLFLVNVRELLSWADVGALRWPVYALVVAATDRLPVLFLVILGTAFIKIDAMGLGKTSSGAVVEAGEGPAK